MNILQLIMSINLQQLYYKFNKKYFDNKLPKPVFLKTSKKEGIASGAYIQKTNKLWIDSKLNSTERINVLLHEMCHMAVCLIDGKYFSNEQKAHGKDWQFWMKKCKQKIGDAYMKPKNIMKNIRCGSKGYGIHNGEYQPIIVLLKIKDKFLCYLIKENDSVFLTQEYIYGKGIVLLDKKLWTKILIYVKQHEKKYYAQINERYISLENNDILFSNDIEIKAETKPYIDVVHRMIKRKNRKT